MTDEGDRPDRDERDRDERGKFVANHGVGAEEVFECMEPSEPYATRELADLLGIPRRSAYKFLETLHEQNRVRKKEAGPQQVIWIRQE